MAPPPQESHRSQWEAPIERIQEDGLLIDGPLTPGGNFLVGRLRGQTLIIPEALTHRHILVCGPSGCGKTTGLFIPNLLMRPNVSAIVTEATAGDDKPQLYARTHQARSTDGRAVYYFNPTDPTSTPINPIDFVHDMQSALQIASVIMKNTELNQKAQSDPHPFFSRAETHILTLLLMYCASRRGGQKQSRRNDGASIGHLRMLLRRPTSDLKEILSDSGNAMVSREFDSFAEGCTAEVILDTLAGLRGRLNLWSEDDGVIARITETTGFDIDQLSEQVFTFYLSTVVHRSIMKPLSALALNFVIEMVLSREFKHPIAMYLDEFANFGHIPDMPELISIVRRRGLALILGLQNLAQLNHVYGERSTNFLTEPSTRIFFRPNHIEHAETVSKSLGSGHRTRLVPTVRGEVTQENVREPLLDSAEAMQLDDDALIVFLPNGLRTSAVKFAPTEQWPQPEVLSRARR